MNWPAFIDTLLLNFRTSTYELQKKHGISTSTLSNIRSGKNVPTNKIIRELEKALDIIIDSRDPENLKYTVIPRNAVPLNSAVDAVYDSPADLKYGNKNTFNYFPVVSVVRAGTPNGIREDDIMEYAIFDYSAKTDVMAVMVSGESMADDLHNGDIVLLDKHAMINNNSIVVAVLDNNEHVIKRYRELTEDLVELYPTNKNFNSLILHKSKLQAVYKVVRSLRKH